jgi:soluble cytochrome b562
MPSNPTPDEMRLALAQQNRVAVPNRPGRTMPADQAKLSYAFTHGLAPMLYGAAKGTAASIPGFVGDINELLRDYVTPRLPTSVQGALAKAPAPYTTEQYVNMMPKMGGHTEAMATKLGSNVVGPIVDPFAVVGAARNIGKPALKAVGETMNQRMLEGKSMVPGLPNAVAPNPAMFAVKPKGGNWVPEQIDQSLKGLKGQIPKFAADQRITQDHSNFLNYYYPEVKNSYDEFFNQSGKHTMDYGTDMWPWIQKNFPKESAELIEGRTPRDYLNNWLDKKLGNYVKNEMGTPTDPLRILADKGITPVKNIAEGEFFRALEKNSKKSIEDFREHLGFPREGYAQTPEGKAWELMTDNSISPETVRSFVSEANIGSTLRQRLMRENPFIGEMLERNPETLLYRVDSSVKDDLGFQHIRDELFNAIRKDSDLPDNLRLKPEALDRVTVPQAVERVAKIDAWRAEQIEKAAAESVKDFPPIKEYKEGFKWHELKMPSHIEDQEQAKGVLEKALKNEGELMGHCVGGYCEDVIDGNSRIFTLRDQKNKPHVTIEGTPGVRRPGSPPAEVIEQFARESAQEANELGYAPNSPEWQNYFRGGQIQKADKWARDNSYETVDIAQIKGKSNGPVTDKYREMVRDFLNSQENIGEVRDLSNVDLVDTGNSRSVVRFLDENYGGDFGLVNSSELYNKVKAANPNMDRFVHAADLSDLVEDVRGPMPEGYKDGGGVSASDSDPSLQFYSRTMDNPDNSKTTEQGIVKQFEQDYMRFALQRHQAPARSDIPNAQPPAARTNIYGEYGTPMLGGMVSGRVTKLGNTPDTYIGDLAYRTPIGPGMAHLGVQGMQNPQMPAKVTNYNAGYGVPLGGNGFAGVNVMQPAQGGKPVIGAQLQYRKQFAKGGAVSIDEMRHELMRNK